MQRLRWFVGWAAISVLMWAAIGGFVYTIVA